MSLAAKLALIVALLVAGFMGGIKYHAGVIAQRDLTAQQQQAKETGIKMARGDKAAVALETDKAKIRTRFITITKEVDRVVQDPAYRAQCFDPAGVQLVNASIAPAATASQPAPAMPGPVATD